MGMSIEEIIRDIKTNILPFDRRESLYGAIDIMRKYQKIEDIVRDYYNEQYTDKLDIEIIEMISEVLEEDGRWED